MANVHTKKGVIGILTGGGDVPGLNPAIRAATFRALSEGYEVIGIRRGWAGLVDMVRDKNHDNSDNYQVLTEEVVNRAGRTGGTFLHSSRTNPAKTKKDDHSHWWCAEHGIPEDECSMCSAKVAKAFKEKGDWCEKHDRAKSQCFLCDPSLKEKYAAKYRAKYGKEPPPIEEEEEKNDDKSGKKDEKK